ncbi:MAG: sugar nucleotide-binding protein [Devosiaceae bacterium]|nr:sugar nucleotide-binding protein [Devosiaceae bacterium]
MKKIAIFGANGRLGREAVKAFHEAGWKVRAVTRNGGFEYVSDVEGVAADALKQDEVIAAVTGNDFILNCLNPDYIKWPELAPPMTKNILAAARAHGAVHLFIGNVYNFGSKMPKLLKINSPQTPDTEKGRVRVQIENMMQMAAKNDGVKTIILRAGDFFGGTGTGSGFDLVVVKDFAKNNVTYPGPLDQIHSWAYLPDLSSAFVELAKRAEQFEMFEIFHFEGHAISGADLIKALEVASNKKLTHKTLPWGFIRTVGLIYPTWREFAQMSYLWQVPHRLDGQKLKDLVPDLQHTNIEIATKAALFDLGRL